MEKIRSAESTGLGSTVSGIPKSVCDAEGLLCKGFVIARCIYSGTISVEDRASMICCYQSSLTVYNQTILFFLTFGFFKV